jgi:hypothetical protein
VIRIHVTRTDEDTGRIVDLGEIRMIEVGSVFMYRETADGAGVMRDIRAALACLSRANVDAVRAAVRAVKNAMNETGVWRS